MEGNLNDIFKNKLQLLYGDYHPIISKFGNTSFGKISSDLCISASQFSKLISGSATQGTYMRSIRNLDQLLEHQKVLKENKQLKKEFIKIKKEPITPAKIIYKKKTIALYVSLGLLLGLIIGLFFTMQKATPELVKSNSKHPLSPFFTKIEHKETYTGFLNEDEVQDYCPSSAYEGKWILAKPYKIPLPGSKNSGVYLLAKSADITMVTSKYASNKGKVLLGFEHLTHEIWVDKTRQALIPEYFNLETKTFTALYENLDFNKDEKFVKIADLKSFYIDEFTINKDSIIRKGQPSGRYVDFIDTKLANKYEIDVEYILNEVISDLTKTKCNSTRNEFCNPNNLKVNSTISFSCFYSINMENLGFGGGYPYTKTIQLVDKNYSDHLICSCPE
ncbi:hypothetical protein [Polaribacter sp.]|uniref:hypothetical protein n=1 Tax=Polaribacter sp. TaxID=1920175 RepID=UPI003EF649A7